MDGPSSSAPQEPSETKRARMDRSRAPSGMPRLSASGRRGYSASWREKNAAWVLKLESVSSSRHRPSQRCSVMVSIPPVWVPVSDRARIQGTYGQGDAMTGVRLLVGTKKGAFVLTSDERRQDWEVSGPHFAGWEIYHMNGA